MSVPPGAPLCGATATTAAAAGIGCAWGTGESMWGTGSMRTWGQGAVVFALCLVGEAAATTAAAAGGLFVWLTGERVCETVLGGWEGVAQARASGAEATHEQ
jgi:hypothetical protein